MNRVGSTAIYGMMLGLVIILLGLYLSPAINESVSSAMNATSGDAIGLDCTNSSISNYDKATCRVTDFSIFYFGGALILIGGAVLTAKIIF